MERIESRINTSSAEFGHNRATAEAAVKRLRADIDRIRGGGSEEARKRHLERGKLLARDRIKRLLDPQSPFLELSILAGWGMYEDEPPGGRNRDRNRARPRTRGDDRRERRNREGRYLLSDHRPQASARPGNRDREPAAVRIPGGFGRRVPAAPGRGLSRSRSLRPDFLQSGADVGGRNRAGRGRDGLVHGRRRLRSRDVRRKRDRARARARSSWAVRRWCAPRPARKSAPKIWAAATFTPASRASATIWPTTTHTRSRSRGRFSIIWVWTIWARARRRRCCPATSPRILTTIPPSCTGSSPPTRASLMRCAK